MGKNEAFKIQYITIIKRLEKFKKQYETPESAELEEERIRETLEKRCISLNSGDFLWFENDALYSISISQNTFRLDQKKLYERQIIIQTMPSSAEKPKDLTNLLEKNEFKLVYSYKVVPSRK